MIYINKQNKAKEEAQVEYAKQLKSKIEEIHASQGHKLLKRLVHAPLVDLLKKARVRMKKRAQIFAEILSTEQRYVVFLFSHRRNTSRILAVKQLK